MSKPPPPRIVPKQGVADGWVSLGVIARAHGLKGALKLHLWNGSKSAALAAGAEVRLGERLVRVRSFANGILTLQGVDDRSAADALCALEVCARRADFPDTGDLYLVDLLGAPVSHVAGHALGTARGFTSNGAQELLFGPCEESLNF